MRIETQFACESLSEDNAVLLLGDPTRTFGVLKEAYSIMGARHEFLCSLHESSEIDSLGEFLNPILKMKYGEKYSSVKASVYSAQILNPEIREMPYLIEMCGKSLEGKTENERKLPIIFIEGIEELFFKLDFPSGPSKLDRGFGNCLRSLWSARKANFCGTIKSKDSPAFLSTMENYDYLFYRRNFREIDVK
jgi:hypothetical protein